MLKPIVSIDSTFSISSNVTPAIRINHHIIPKLSHYKLNKITNIVVQDFYNSLINEGAKPSTAKRITGTLGNCLRYAHKNKLIYNLPIDIELVAIGKSKINFWNKNQVDFFVNKIKDTYLYTPVLIEALTGLRIAELCELRWCDIDFDNKYLNVKNQVIYDKINHRLVFTDKLKTPTSYRKITLPKVLINYLKSIKGNALDTDFIVLGYDSLMLIPKIYQIILLMHFQDIKIH